MRLASTWKHTGAAGRRPGDVSRHRPDSGSSRPADGSREELAVPRARFRSYYGRPVLKPPAWEWRIPAYFFTGGLSAGSALLAAGADLTGRPALRRAGRLGGFAALLVSMYLLVADLGRPERFHHMLRVAKPSSPMSIGTWILVAYGPGSALAAAAEILPKRLRPTLAGRLLQAAARPAGLSAAAFAPGVASYTAALLAQTAVPAWHEARRELPFVYTGSAAASGAGLGLLCTPVAEAAPDRLHRLAGYLTLGGGIIAVTLARRSRAAAAVAGLALLGGSVLQRYGTFGAGVASTKDPRYVVEPQRARLDAAASSPE